MKTRVLCGLCLAAILCSAQEIVKNGNFSAEAENGAMPPAWKSRSEKCWGFRNDDGIVSAHDRPACLQFTGSSQQAAPATQKITLKPDTAYVLSASIKRNGAMPEIKVVDASGKVLVTLSPNRDVNNLWQECLAEFRSASEPDCSVLLTGSTALSQGTAFFDNVLIMEGDEAALKKSASATNLFQPAGRNIAAGKSYTYAPEPNYDLCADAGDGKQLTDGVYTQGAFWVQKSTVGWSSPQVEIIVDLGQEEPVSGVSWSCAAGISGVSWPFCINLFISLDRTHWEPLGDLTKLSAKYAVPPAGEYATFTYGTNELKTKGRYLMFQVLSDFFIFSDEIQVLRGPDSWLEELHPDYPVTDVSKIARQAIIAEGVKQRMAQDLAAAETELSKLAEPRRSQALAQAKELRNHFGNPIPEGDFKTILPLNETHEKIFALNTFRLQQAGFRKPFFWHSSRWGNLPLTAMPEKAPVPLPTVEMIRNEVRSEAINICNPTFAPLHYTVSVEGLPAEANPELCEVLVTDTKSHVAIAAALQQSDRPALALTVPAGCTRQLWLRFNRPMLSAGKYHGFVKATSEAGTLQAPLTLTIHDFLFPKQPAMSVGGWDYTNGDDADFPNLQERLAIMRDFYTDSPWSTNHTVPGGARFDENGHLTNPGELDFSKWDHWVKRWEGARYYCVFWNVQEHMGQHRMGTPAFKTAVAEYMQAWCEHIRKQGKSPEQLVLMLRDETHSHEEDAQIALWGEAVSAAKTGAQTLSDPIYSNPNDGLPEMYAAVDILVPNTMMRNEVMIDFYQKQRQNGKKLWLYECSGPAKLHDPVIYHRAQCWIAWAFGATGSFYWQFGCGGGIGNSWNSYLQTVPEYSPYFVSPTKLMHGKHSEAIREGVQDFEYIVMLQNRITELRKAGKTAVADQAQTVLDDVVRQALREVGEVGTCDWNAVRDQEIFDRARIKLLETLEKMR